ncbi:MAG TPA: hypothetical protein VJO52_12665 [Gemmatimonadaceae bacterium]|nr:hypothetical protein [Gemmatimonadaceae bacterium]
MTARITSDRSAAHCGRIDSGQDRVRFLKRLFGEVCKVACASVGDQLVVLVFQETVRQGFLGKADAAFFAKKRCAVSVRVRVFRYRLVDP